MFAFLRNLFSSRGAAPVAVETTAPVVEVSQEVMDAAFDRSAGRWCEECKMNGSHHTDKHNEFARAALADAGIWPFDERGDRRA